MNSLTAVFMDVLGSKTDQSEKAAELVHSNMLSMYRETMHDIISSETLVFSSEGRRLKQEALMLETMMTKMERAKEAAGLCSQLKELSARMESLHRETQEEIHKTGHIRAERLHFFYAQEQEEAFDILENYIKTELYRVLVIGGGDLFFLLKPLRGFQRTLQERMKYLKEEIAKVTDTREFENMAESCLWAYSHRESMKVGPMGLLPGFVTVKPVKSRRVFKTGDHGIFPGEKGGAVLQGFGALTNVTPENVERAQTRGALETEVFPEQLHPFEDSLNDPDVVLGKIFSGKLYAIDPAQYFGTASYVEANETIVQRARLGKCLFCGQAAEGQNFCRKCANRIRIV